MEVATLELNIISAQDLKKVSTFGHDTCYAVAYIYSSEKKATGVDRDGGENPSWNAKLTLFCDDKLLRHGRSHIIVEIYSYGSFSNKLVGTAMISLAEVGKQKAGQPQFMAFEVRRPSGKVKGVLNVSVKVGDKQMVNERNHSGQAFSAFSSADSRIKAQQKVPALTGYNQTYPHVQAYPPPSWSKQGGTAASYPPPTTSYDPSVANNGVSVYPPPKSSSVPTGSEANNGGAVSPPPRPSGDSSATSTSDSKKDEEPVLAYPASGVPGAYPPPRYGQYYGSQGYYPGAQLPYGYQQQYSKPQYRGSSSTSNTGLGLLGGVLGGLLLGDVIGGIF